MEDKLNKVVKKGREGHSENSNLKKQIQGILHDKGIIMLWQ